MCPPGWGILADVLLAPHEEVVVGVVSIQGLDSSVQSYGRCSLDPVSILSFLSRALRSATKVRMLGGENMPMLVQLAL